MDKVETVSCSEISYGELPMTMDESKTAAKEFEKFLRDISYGREFADKLLDGTPVNIILDGPHAPSASRAAALLDDIITKKDLEASAVESIGKLVRLSCVSCIRGVTDENVMAFLRRFPPNPPIVKECLRQLCITDEQMKRIGIEPNEEN